MGGVNRIGGCRIVGEMRGVVSDGPRARGCSCHGRKRRSREDARRAKTAPRNDTTLPSVEVGWFAVIRRRDEGDMRVVVCGGGVPHTSRLRYRTTANHPSPSKLPPCRSEARTWPAEQNRACSLARQEQPRGLGPSVAVGQSRCSVSVLGLTVLDRINAGVNGNVRYRNGDVDVGGYR